MNDHQIEIVKRRAMERYPLDLRGVHGCAHWERVYENGQLLVQHNGGDPVVVGLFAWLHDCCRESEGGDPDHGARAAAFATSLREDCLRLEDRQFEQLHTACARHNLGDIASCPTIGACFDADRLDLGRVGFTPDPNLLSTAWAQRPEVIRWALLRSRGQDTPPPE